MLFNEVNSSKSGQNNYLFEKNAVLILFFFLNACYVLMWI